MFENQRSFSLIELMIVVSLMVVLVSFLIPDISFRKDLLLIQELDRLEALFYTLQQRAVSTGEKIVLSFDIDKNSYSYKALSNGLNFATLSSGIRFGIVGGALGPPWKAIEKIENLITFAKINEKPAVVFFQNGKMSSGTIYLCDENGVGGALTCAVSQVFYIRKYMYNDKQWKLVNLP